MGAVASLDTYTFPSSSDLLTVKGLYGEELKAFPALAEQDYFNRHTEPVRIHPVIEALRKHSIEEVELGKEWMNAGESCFNITLVVNGQRYGFSMWWVTKEVYWILFLASKKKWTRRAQLREYILSMFKE